MYGELSCAGVAATLDAEKRDTFIASSERFIPREESHVMWLTGNAPFLAAPCAAEPVEYNGVPFSFAPHCLRAVAVAEIAELQRDLEPLALAHPQRSRPRRRCDRVELRRAYRAGDPSRRAASAFVRLVRRIASIVSASFRRGVGMGPRCTPSS